MKLIRQPEVAHLERVKFKTATTLSFDLFVLNDHKGLIKKINNFT